jgi:DUF1680 family protein
MSPVARRDFLKTATAALAGAAADRAGAPAHAAQAPGSVRISSASYTPRDYPIRPTRFADVTLEDAFWKPRVATNAAVTIPLQIRKLAESGRDLGGNTLEAAILSLQTHPDPALQQQVDARIRELAAQVPRGNGGFEVAATWFHATGRRDLIDQARKAAAALYADFRTNDPPFSGGERDAVNCVQLYTVTRDRTHLDLAKHYLDIRGLPNSVSRSRHNQSHKPVLEQSEAVGHAVNGLTLMVSLLDVGILTGMKEYVSAARRMWQDVVARKMYVTGGAGSTGNEGFGEPYALPNISAYAETCAVLMFITLNHRLFLATGDARYIDVMERGMYNNALSGVSSAGDRFFYVNRLASAGDGRDVRWERASLECCPPNLVRFLARMPGYVYATDADGAIYVNLYVSSRAAFEDAGTPIALSVESGMPWGGRTRITVSAKARVRRTLKLRIPGWARNQPVPGTLYTYLDAAGGHPTVSVNGRKAAAVPDAAGYVSFDREWADGDAIEVEFPMAIRRVAADERVRECRRRMAVERGPIVYCAEWPEVRDKRALDLLFDVSEPMEAAGDAPLAGGATVIRTRARSLTRPSSPPEPVTLVPYALWANRGPGEMTVWLPTSEYAPGDTGPAGGLIFCVNPNWAADGWRYLEAAPVDQSGGARWGCFRTGFSGARGTAVGAGRQNTADILAACSEPGTAAHLCATYSLNGVRGWFLPSRDELALMYANLKARGHGDFRDAGMTDNCLYWSSSQQSVDMAVHIDFADNGRLHYDDKDFPRRVRAIRAF